MSYSRGERTTTTLDGIKSRLLDAHLVAESIGDTIRLCQLTDAESKEIALTDIGILLNIIDENVEVLNAWQEALPRIVLSEEAKIRLDPDNRR